jgi:hypothetical protein
MQWHETHANLHRKGLVPIVPKGIKGTGYFSPVAIACSGVIDAPDAENPAWAASWFCLSCDQPRKWSRRLSFTKLRTILACACSKRSKSALSPIEGFEPAPAGGSKFNAPLGKGVQGSEFKVQGDFRKRSNRSSRSIDSLRSKPCGGSKFKVQVF